MHWFNSQLQILFKLAEAYETCQSKKAGENLEESRQARIAFINNVQSLVDSVVKLPVISGCVAGHDGFIMAKAGSVSDSDALGALIQENMVIAERSKQLLGLGEIQQIVIVGERNKIAMISVGQVTLCILSPKQSNLAELLSLKPN